MAGRWPSGLTACPMGCIFCSGGTRASDFDGALGADVKVVEGKGLGDVHHAVRASAERPQPVAASSASTPGMHASSQPILPLASAASSSGTQSALLAEVRHVKATELKERTKAAQAAPDEHAAAGSHTNRKTTLDVRFFKKTIYSRRWWIRSTC